VPPLKYHQGQLSIQQEAKTSMVAAKLADWVGPVVEFALGADIFLLASDSDGELGFTVLSGAPPLLASDGQLQRRHEHGQPDEAGVLLRFPRRLLPPLAAPTPCGGLAISLASSRRARINGVLSAGEETADLVAEETFTLCRKYIAPSVPLAREPHAGPVSREPISRDDPWLLDLLARAETSFLATISPAGRPDISHRGGPPGFLRLNPAAGEVSWDEYVGDGIFKSAGNLRATRRFALLVPEVESGDGAQLVGSGEYTNIRGDRRQRLDPLVQHREEFPVQGVMTCKLDSVYRLRALMQPRQRLEARPRISSASSVDEQAPQ